MADKFLSGKKTSKFDIINGQIGVVSKFDEVETKIEDLNKKIDDKSEEIREVFDNKLDREIYEVKQIHTNDLVNLTHMTVGLFAELLRIIIPILLSKPFLFLNRIFKLYIVDLNANITYNTENDVLGVHPQSAKQEIVSITNVRLTVRPACVDRSYHNKVDAKNVWKNSYAHSKWVYRRIKEYAKRHNVRLPVNVNFESDFTPDQIYILYI